MGRIFSRLSRDRGGFDGLSGPEPRASFEPYPPLSLAHLTPALELPTSTVLTESAFSFLDPGSAHIPVLAAMTPSCRHLPMQKVEKIAPSRSSLVNSPVISPSARCAARSS